MVNKNVSLALSASLRTVLVAAAQASGNRERFLQAGLIDRAGRLVDGWEAAFRRLAPLMKDDVRSRPGQFLASADDVVYRGKTSGTTSSAPFTYFAGDLWNQKRIESRQQSLSRWGLSEQTPVLNLASRLGPVRMQDSSLVGPVDDAFLEKLLQILASESVILRGYPSRLCEVAVALHCYHLSIDIHSVAAVISTGECLFEFQKELLSKVFCAPVINEYGCQETGISGMSCPEVGRLHLDGELTFDLTFPKDYQRCLYEVVDGRLLTTDLFNTTMPMVRYCSGDALEVLTDPCLCGRPGATVKVLGREEEKISIAGKPVYLGDIRLPSFAGVLNYQIQIGADTRQLWLQPETGSDPDLGSIRKWLKETLGAGNAQVLIEPSSSFRSRAEAGLKGVSSDDWARQVTCAAWSDWLSLPLPFGNAEAIAALLKSLVAPRHIVLKALPLSVLSQIDALVRSQPDSNVELEAIKIRVLLWAISLMAQNEAAIAHYHTLLSRFQAWADTVNVEEFSALGFDLIAPMLTLDTLTVKSLWPVVQKSIQQCWPNGLKADTFTMHHYLAVLDVAGQLVQKRRQQAHPWMPALRPLAAIFVGDLLRFSNKLSVSIVATWIEIVHIDLQPHAIAGHSFQALWETERRSLLIKDSASVFESIDRLFCAANSPMLTAQCWLEKGYALLVFEEPFDLKEWMSVIHQYVGALGQSTANPLPWTPILNALAPELVKNGYSEIAYDYWVAAAPPNRILSNFDRQSKAVNRKQSVMKHVDYSLERP